MAEKKQLDIKALIKVLLEEGLTLWAMKSIPVVGDLIELKERVELARKLETFLQQSVMQAERIAVLEQLAGLSQGQMEQMIQELMPQLDKNQAPPETQQFVTEWIAQIPQAAARKTTATRQLGSALPLDSSEFYQDLIPARRPQDWSGQALPHRSPPWELQQLLGLGGFGEVWLAQNGLQQEAIKFCHDDARRAFLVKEFKTLQKMQAGLKNHPNIVQLKEFHLEGASPYWLAFEYMDGGDLFSLMQQRHLAWHDALILFRGIVSGVAAAHKLGFVHRDLKPANILLTADGVPKIADFGLSEALAVDLHSTADMGTVGYVSPEQLARKVAPSDDMYALGVIFWQLVTHTLHPPSGKAELESKLKASTIPKAAKKLVQQCLGKQANRPQNAGELLQPLEILLVKQKSTLLTSVIRWVLRKKVAEHLPSVPIPPAQEIPKAKEVPPVKEAAPKAKEIPPDKAMPKTKATTSGLDLAADWEQMKTLVTVDTRDKGWETAAEYQKRINAATGLLISRRYLFELKNLGDFAYRILNDADPDNGVLVCKAPLPSILLTEELVFEVTTPINREYAKLCRVNAERFSLEVVLALEATPRIVVTQATLKLAGIGEFPGQATLKIFNRICEFVQVPAGSFNMGSNSGDSDEKPVHKVNIKAFMIGKYPVTQRQWQAVMGSNPAHFAGCDDCPVESVSWDDIQGFLAKLNSQWAGLYRLPTEAEWEYAARSGGKDELYAEGNNLDAVAWYDGNSGGKTHPVGQKQPNGLGIYDMSGNVWEWCADVWHDDYTGAPADGSAWTAGGNSAERVLRGGSWLNEPEFLRSALRLRDAPDGRYYLFGFRLVLVAPRSK